MSNLLNRRAFLTRSLHALSGTCLASGVGGNLALAQATLNASSQKFNDYKALVCVFLRGGNDSFNMLVPKSSSEYKKYQKIRNKLAYKRENLLSLTGLDYGMPNQMVELQRLFNKKQLAVVANMGTLIHPVTKNKLKAQPKLAPTQLFSHNSQMAMWQQLLPAGKATTGWAGRMADLLYDSKSVLPISYNVNQKNPWQTGFNTIPYSVGSRGPTNYYALNGDYEHDEYRHRIFNEMIGQPSHMMEKAFFDIRKRTTKINRLLLPAFKEAGNTHTEYPDNELAKQLAVIAKLISVQSQLKQKRQIFYVDLSGWDTHDGQAFRHPSLLQKLSQALGAFYENLQEINMTDQVTTFTLSEFGRTLTINNDGTDHGWGGHQLVMGGAVSGGQLYGNLPDMQLGSNDDFGKGRMIPSIAVEQYAATLASWFGLSHNELKAVFPHLAHFDEANLGFMS